MKERLKPEKVSPKKKIAKKAGAAVAAGVAGKKISENLREKITPGDTEKYDEVVKCSGCGSDKGAH